MIPSPARHEDPDLANAWVLKEVETHAAIRSRQATADAKRAEATGGIDGRRQTTEWPATPATLEEPANG